MKETTPEKKSVKTLKGQLFGAVSMMLVAAIALGTSTYAWFINNRTVEVQNMQLTVSTSTSMLVAIGKNAGIAATGVPTTWTGYKSTISNPDISGTGAGSDKADWAQFFTNKMTPASVTTASLGTVTPNFFITNNHVTDGKLDEFEPVPAIDKTDNSVTTYGVGQGPVKKLSLRFLASNNIDVYFAKTGLATIANLVTPAITDEMVNTPKPGVTPEALYTQLEANASKAEAEAIKKALRVSVVAHQSGVGADLTPNLTAYADTVVRTFQFDSGNILTDTNNTDYNGHTDVAIAENNGIYRAIASLEAAPSKKIATVGQLDALVPAHGTSANNADKSLGTVKADGTIEIPGTDPAELFTLDANVARDVDVYIWLEGTDRDCLNALSGFLFNLNLPFAGADRVETTP